ncbi:MAG: hypothetical protein SGBAC_000365 [Bacillariaceae sp.]
MRLNRFHLTVIISSFLLLYCIAFSWSIYNLQPRSAIQHEPKQILNPKLEELASVDYYACCGLGHRLVRMSLAAYVAKQRGFELRAFWGWCGEKAPIEVFSYLFRPYLEQEVFRVESRGLLLPFYNEVSGFPAISRTPVTDQGECACPKDKIASDFEFYTSLRDRFRGKPQVDAFVRDNFSNATVIGIHIRAGNGEGGDFDRKGRSVNNPHMWVGHVVKLVLQEGFRKTESNKFVVYIATDTPSMIELFRNQLYPHQIKVLDLPQRRMEEGSGVMFGEAAKVHNKGDETDDYSSCLEGWIETLSDMFLLSYADVVIAATPSSFSQTAPMSLAFGKEAQGVKTPYCEIIPKFEQFERNGSTKWQEVAPTMQCYKSYVDWCCNYSTWIKFKKQGRQNRTKIISKEFVRFPVPGDEGRVKDYPGLRNRTLDCPRPGRGRVAGGLKDKCLPHAWVLQ